MSLNSRIKVCAVAHNIEFAVVHDILLNTASPLLILPIGQVFLRRYVWKGSHFQLLRMYSLMVEVRILVKFRNDDTLLNMRYMFPAS